MNEPLPIPEPYKHPPYSTLTVKQNIITSVIYACVVDELVTVNHPYYPEPIHINKLKLPQLKKITLPKLEGTLTEK